MLNEHFEKESQLESMTSKDTLVLKDQVDKHYKELSLKAKELQDVTLLLAKKDKEITGLKKEAELSHQKGRQSAEEEVLRMKDYVKTLEAEFKQRKENSENVVERLKEFTYSTLRIQNDQGGCWESSLTKALASSAQEHINFLRAVQGQRVLFMPHSPGIYIALVLKQLQDIEADQLEYQSAFKSKDMNANTTSSSIAKSDGAGSVKRLIIKNNLFLDIESLSKNLQTILK